MGSEMCIRDRSISIGYEVGIQNGTLALMVAGMLVGNDTMMIPAITYSAFMFITGFVFGFVMKKSSKRTSSSV